MHSWYLLLIFQTLLVDARVPNFDHWDAAPLLGGLRTVVGLREIGWLEIAVWV